MAKEKVQVVGEDLSETKVALFLDMQPYGNENADFHVLLKAYRGLPPDAFSRFMQLFKDSGRDLNAKSLNGQTILDVARQNVRHPEFVEILQAFGAH